MAIKPWLLNINFFLGGGGGGWPNQHDLLDLLIYLVTYGSSLEQHLFIRKTTNLKSTQKHISTKM